MKDKALRDLIELRALTRGEFTLASGARSSYYLDLRKISVCRQGAHKIGPTLAERIHPLSADCIGGMATGAIPLVTATVMYCPGPGGDAGLAGFWVRDRFKDHGMGSLIEGNIDGCYRAVIVEDVITSGQSTMRAVDAVRKIGIGVVGVIALVDRLAGAEALLRAQGVPHYESIFTIRDFGVEP